MANPAERGTEPTEPERKTARRHGVELPDYLPARMLNEFVYCPRLFFYEWVEGVFAQSADTVEGALRHEELEIKADALPPPVNPSASPLGKGRAEEGPSPQTAAAEAKIRARSVELASETYKLIAKIDLVEGEGGVVNPVDYKRGAPRDTDDGPEA
jgi:CRISPR-associated protein Cas1